MYRHQSRFGQGGRSHQNHRKKSLKVWGTEGTSHHRNQKGDDDGWGPIATESWADSILKRNNEFPEKSKPTEKPLVAFSRPTDKGHTLMHWSFCRDYNCQYHRGEQSWYY